MKAAAIILAAGESRRMGRPKALLPFRGGTFLSEIAGTFQCRCSPVIAVFGYDGVRVARSAPEGILPVQNPDYELGMLSSLKAGLRAVPDACDAAFFTLVDHPAVSAETIDSLFESQSTIAIPRLDGRRGHPVLIRRELFAEFLSEPLESKVRNVIDRHAPEIAYIEVGDRGISDDIDDPRLYDDLLAREALRP